MSYSLIIFLTIYSSEAKNWCRTGATCSNFLVFLVCSFDSVLVEPQLSVLFHVSSINFIYSLWRQFETKVASVHFTKQTDPICIQKYTVNSITQRDNPAFHLIVLIQCSQWILNLMIYLKEKHSSYWCPFIQAFLNLLGYKILAAG